jgi:RNA polymerase sigma-70 factor, ECF subfamily
LARRRRNIETAEADPTHRPLGEALAAQHNLGAPASPELVRRIESEIPFLRRTVRRWHREQADADDLVQDTLLQALANAHLWQQGTDLRAWLFTIMRNQFLAAAIRSSRAASALQAIATADAGCAADVREARLVLRDVAAVLRRLPQKQRTAVLLVCIEGKSYEDVARTIGASVGAVRCHLARGRFRLRTAVNAAESRSPFAPRPARTPPPPALPPAFPNIPLRPVLEAAD